MRRAGAEAAQFALLSRVGFHPLFLTTYTHYVFAALFISLLFHPNWLFLARRLLWGGRSFLRLLQKG
jgi:hypothetical protein